MVTICQVKGKNMKKNKDIPSQADILAVLRQAKEYRLQAEAETRRQLALLDIIEAAYGPSIPAIVENDSTTE